MTAVNPLVHLAVVRLLCPLRVISPNWKAQYGESRPLRLERGKGCKALPIATVLLV